MLPHLGLDIDQSKIVPLQSAAMQIAESNPGDKWLLSYAKPGPVDEFRIVINQAWVGAYSSGTEMASALDAALYQK
jgi:hypothetical protein